MAARMGECASGNLKVVLSIFRTLSNTDRSKIVDLDFSFTTGSNFDDLLTLNLRLLWKNLKNEENLKDFGKLVSYLDKLFGAKSILESGEKSLNGASILLNNREDSRSVFNTSNVGANASSIVVRWVFYKVCLQALCCLKSTLQSTKGCEKSTRDPAVDLSISDQQVVKTVIQFIVVLGVCPNLLEGVGIPIEQRTGFSVALLSGHSVKCPNCLYECVTTLVMCLNEPTLSLGILSKHLADILAALMQLSYCDEVCDGSDADQLIGQHLSTNGVVTPDVDHQTSLYESDTLLNQQTNANELFSYLKICEGGLKISKTQQDECKKALNNLVNKMYQPLIIRELLFLQGSMSTPKTRPKDANSVKVGNVNVAKMSADINADSNNAKLEKTKETKLRTPVWMQDVCGHLLSKCLTKKNGVQSVLQAVLEGTSGGASEWKVCEAIAKVIANCPLQIQNAEEYYKSISPQVLTLLKLPSSNLQQQYSRASVLIIHTMLRKHPEAASRYVADPLMRPFLIASHEPGCKGTTVLVDEKEMTCCIEGLHKVFVASPNSCQVLTESMERIVVPIFELLCFVRHSASHVKTALLEVLVTFFKRTNNFTAMATLYVFVCKELPDFPAAKSLLLSNNLDEHENEAMGDVSKRTGAVGKRSDRFGKRSDSVGKRTEDVGKRSKNVETCIIEDDGKCTKGVGKHAGDFGKRSQDVEKHSKNVGEQRSGDVEKPIMEDVGKCVEGVGKHPGDVGTRTEGLGKLSKGNGKRSEEVGDHSESAVFKIRLIAKSCKFGFGEAGGVILEKVDPSKTTNANPFAEVLGNKNKNYETRALCLVEVLQNLRRDDIPGNFFLYLLQQVQEIILMPNFGEIGKLKALVIFNTLALMCEKLGPSVLKNTGHMIRFINTTLTRAHRVYMESGAEEAGDGAFELDTMTMALGMLSALLGGAVKVETSDYAKLRSLTPILREIAEHHTQEEITEQASDLLVVILTKTSTLADKSRGRTVQSVADETGMGIRVGINGSLVEEYQTNLDYDTAIEQLCDPLLPVRGHALMTLANLLKSRDGKALEDINILLKTFKDSLIHEDSYIYLAAVEGLVAATDVRPDDVIPQLAREFMASCGEETGASDNEDDKGQYEGIAKASSKKGAIKRSPATRLKLGEALTRAVKRCGDVAPRYFQILVHAFLAGARDEESVIRASSLSNLAEICRLSPRVFATVMHEVFLCIDTVLRSDEANEVRQAAVLVLTLVFSGLGENTVEVLSDKLKDIYQLLKFVESRDKDSTTRTHAQVALGALETSMRAQLFPEQKLVKHITILP